MKRGLFLVFAVCWVSIICMVAAAQGNQTKSQPAPSAKAQETAPDESAEGEKLFQTHCGRCHNAPESISPREARAVVRHMRVRATLTNEDERLILKFLAP
jgi:cytochrome c5